MTGLGRMWSLIRPYRWSVAAALLASAATTSGWLSVPALIRTMLGEAIAGRHTAFSPLFVLALLGGLLVLTTMNYAAVLLMHHVAYRATADLRTAYVDRLLQIPLSFHRSRPSGEIIDRLVGGVKDIERFLRHLLVGVLGIAVLLCGALVMIFLLNWKLALGTIVMFPLVSFGLRFLLGRTRRAFQNGDEASARLTSYLQNLLLGIDVIKAFNGREIETERFARQQSVLLATQRDGARFAALLEPMLIALVVGTILLVLAFGSWEVSVGQLAPETLVAFLLYTLILIPQAKGVSVVYLGWQQTVLALQRLDEVIALPAEADVAGARNLPVGVRGMLEIRGVSYVYPGRTRALDRLSLTVHPGECVGLVGASGAGKSTLFSLLLRFYQPTGGLILLDGLDIQRITLHSLRNALAIVPQDTMLFDGTILDNVRYGKPGASDDEVRTACRNAQADEFIATLPGSYQTMVGERGLMLSGGQRQRLAIARALLKDAPVLLLDEASSSLDAQTEHLLHGALSAATRGRTTLIIAHRLATVVNLSRIIVLHQGRVVDEGTHGELLRHCEQYRTLVVPQLIPAAGEDHEAIHNIRTLSMQAQG